MDKVNTIFEVLGPIMIGPSSSHTAGAARLAKIAKYIAQDEVKKVIFYLHGSFAKTYKGHGTDRALVAGILGYDSDDEKLRDSLKIASDMGISYEFIPADLGVVHPNTIKFVMTTVTGEIVTVVGSSIGGGSVRIIDVNDFEVDFSGDYDTLVMRYLDKRGTVSEVSGILAHHCINIANMTVTRYPGEHEVTAIIELDAPLEDMALSLIEEIPHMNKVLLVKK